MRVIYQIFLTLITITNIVENEYLKSYNHKWIIFWEKNQCYTLQILFQIVHKIFKMSKKSLKIPNVQSGAANQKG